MKEPVRQAKVKPVTAKQQLREWQEKHAKKQVFERKRGIVLNSHVMLSHLSPGRGFRRPSYEVYGTCNKG